MLSNRNDAETPHWTVVMDLGGVLIDWNPRYLYRKLFDDDARMEHFLTAVCSQTWHERARRWAHVCRGHRGPTSAPRRPRRDDPRL